MKILLTGASGFIGCHIKHALNKCEDYELITPSHCDADYTINITTEDWLSLLEGIDVVINSVGIITETKQQSFSNLHSKAPIALFQACEQMGVKRVIQISALGVDEHAFTSYQTSKLEADNILRGLSLTAFILRPSLVYGQGGASLAMFERLASLPVIALPDAGNQWVQPVYISDLVATVEQCLQTDPYPSKACRTIDVVGPTAMTLAEYILAIRASLQKPAKYKARVIAIPSSFVLFVAQLVHHFIPIMHPDNLRMLQQGNTADVDPLITLLGRSPLAVEEGLQFRGRLKAELRGESK